MGDRADVILNGMAMYLHWNGYPEFVGELLSKLRNRVTPDKRTEHPECFTARMVQIAGKMIGGSLSLGLRRAEYSRDQWNQADNGFYRLDSCGFLADSFYSSLVGQTGFKSVSDFIDEEYPESSRDKELPEIQFLQDERNPRYILTVPGGECCLTVQFPEEFKGREASILRGVLTLCERQGFRRWDQDDYGMARLCQTLCDLCPDYLAVGAERYSALLVQKDYPQAECIFLDGWTPTRMKPVAEVCGEEDMRLLEERILRK